MALFFIRSERVLQPFTSTWGGALSFIIKRVIFLIAVQLQDVVDEEKQKKNHTEILYEQSHRMRFVKINILSEYSESRKYRRNI